MYKEYKILIVGTTPDYIEIIHKEYKGKVVFLNTPFSRHGQYDYTSNNDFFSIDDTLSNINITLKNLDNYLSANSIKLKGICCFDCESFELASIIAEKYNLPFPNLNTINICRNKDFFKHFMSYNKITVPNASKIESLNTLLKFMNSTNNKCVLKPCTGSGSELVFKVSNKSEAGKAFNTIRNTLRMKQSSYLYNSFYGTGNTGIIAEELIEGTEYSCDFYLQKGNLKITRITEKLKSETMPFGTILGYRLADTIPGIEMGDFRKLLIKCLTVLELQNIICMIDFIVNKNKITILELTPRPGGDCLPTLISHAYGINIINMHIDISSGKLLTDKTAGQLINLTAFRIFAPNSGILKNVNTSSISNNKDILEIKLYHEPGTKIEIPPASYETWGLGHVILKETESENWYEKYKEIINRLHIEIQ